MASRTVLTTPDVGEEVYKNSTLVDHGTGSAYLNDATSSNSDASSQTDSAPVSGIYKSGNGDYIYKKSNMPLQSDKEIYDENLQKQRILAGLMVAKQQGGYAAMQTFLNNTDPVAAKALQAQHDNLHQSIESNPTVKSQSDDNKFKATVEGYQVYGNVANKILSAPDADKENLYKMSYPIIKALDPNAPVSFKDGGENRLTLVKSSSDLRSFALLTQGQMTKAQTETAKAFQDDQALAAQGIPETAEVRQSLQSKIRESMLEEKKARSNLNDLSLNAADKTSPDAPKNVSIMEGWNNSLRQESDSLYKVVGPANAIKTALDTLANDPNNSSAQGMLANGFVQLNGLKRNNPYVNSLLSDTSSGADKVMQWAEGNLKGSTQNLNKNDIGNVRSAFEKFVKTQASNQNSIEQPYIDRVNRAGGLFRVEDLRLPSRMLNMYGAVPQQAGQQQQQQQQPQADWLQELPDGVIKQQALDALKRGAPPEGVRQRIESMMRGGGANGQ